MRKSRVLETRGDRQALARDAGLGRVSVVSVLAGALSSYGALAALLAIAGLVAVAVNGGHDFGNVNGARFKEVTAVIVVLAAFVAFVFGGYTAGRMSRRSGATNGVVAGVVGVILGIAIIAVARIAGGGSSLHRVALHLNVPSTWVDWRSAALVGGGMSLVAMILGSLMGGGAGERWHAKLLARAADSAYGPEAERLADARRAEAEAESAHVAAQERVTRATAVSTLPGHPAVVDPAAPDTTVADTRAADTAVTPVAADRGAGGGSKPRRRHLLHR